MKVGGAIRWKGNEQMNHQIERTTGENDWTAKPANWWKFW